MISIIQSHFIARDVIRFWITAQSNFNDISKYIKYSTSFDVPLLRVTHFPLGVMSSGNTVRKPSPSADVGKCRCTDVKGLSEEYCVRQLVCVSLASTGIAFMLTLPGREPPSPRCGGIRIESTLKRSTLRH